MAAIPAREADIAWQAELLEAEQVASREMTGDSLETDDAYAACEQVKAKGGKVTREAGPMKHGTTVIAFVEDPDGYKIELIQKNTL